MWKRVAAWFCLLGGGALNIERLLTGGSIHPSSLLLVAIAVLYFQRNGFLGSKQETIDDRKTPDP